MKISIAQLDIVQEEAHTNQQKVANCFSEADRQQSQLIIFPEMTLTGFSINAEKVLKEHSDAMSFFKNMSMKHNITSVFGYVDKSETTVARNRCIVISNQGAVISEYTKIHPFSYMHEHKFYESGNKISTFALHEMAFSTFICYDLRFPEIFQCASKNVDVMIVIANWPASRIEHWDILLKARAIENQCYVIGCNRTGTSGNLAYCGHSVVVSPTGILVGQPNDQEGLFSCVIDKQQVADYRKSFTLKRDRNTDLYKSMY